MYAAREDVVRWTIKFLFFVTKFHCNTSDPLLWKKTNIGPLEINHNMSNILATRPTTCPDTLVNSSQLIRWLQVHIMKIPQNWVHSGTKQTGKLQKKYLTSRILWVSYTILGKYIWQIKTHSNDSSLMNSLASLERLASFESFFESS